MWVTFLGSGEAGEVITGEQRAVLDALHLRRIDLADRVLIVNTSSAS